MRSRDIPRNHNCAHDIPALDYRENGLPFHYVAVSKSEILLRIYNECRRTIYTLSTLDLPNEAPS